ncbi:hypothetical protein [Stratiformator vulcanicus]|uniref:Uncharacterized protein n=1 Tax=Stratiformator vulcanicus TaxID=2527980 RepID=A0A517QZQ8_9PLAN|nr:hypothetical protein [Stratiformator vulcanicus]QDT37132.1 hypothetical protein Pan189_15000 [Stratiformator vulcanicus]
MGESSERDYELSIKFLNVDLDVVSTRPTAPLTKSLDGIAYPLHETASDGQYLASYELTEPEKRAGTEFNAEQMVLEFCDAIAALTGDALSVWVLASKKEFNLGFDSGLHPRNLQWSLQPETLQRVADVDAALVITIYAVSTGDEVSA